MKSAIFQAFLVVLGVVLALGANEWREARAKDERARVALDSIHEEIAANARAVNESLAYHKERLALIAERGDALLSLKDFPKGFLRPASLSDAAWTSASEAGVFNDIPFAEILRLSAVYAEQERCERQSAVSGELIYRRLFEDGYGAMVGDPLGLMTLLNSSQYLEAGLAASLAAAARPEGSQPSP